MRPASAGEPEQLPDDAAHLLPRLDDDAGVVARLFDARFALGNHVGARDDHVERRPELVGDARGELSHGVQPLGAAELLEGRDARGRLPRDAARRPRPVHWPWRSSRPQALRARRGKRTSEARRSPCAPCVEPSRPARAPACPRATSRARTRKQRGQQPERRGGPDAVEDRPSRERALGVKVLRQLDGSLVLADGNRGIREALVFAAVPGEMTVVVVPGARTCSSMATATCRLSSEASSSETQRMWICPLPHWRRR